MTSSNTPVVYEDEIVTRPGARRFLAVLRILVGFYFLWAFIDKLFGLHFSTASEKSILNGGTPAQSFINHAADSTPFGGFLKLFANPVGDWIFMIGLLGLGLALLLGMGVKVAGVTGPILMLLMWLAEFPPTHSLNATNPIMDDHWIFAAAFIIVALTRAGDTWGLGKWWSSKVGESWLR